MIGCPYCGTLNRKGSRYCSKCGERLDTVPSTRCPSCNAPNLSSNEYCAFCGAVLNVTYEESGAGTPPSMPGSAPTVETEIAEGEMEASAAETLPSWLYEPPADEEATIAPAAASSTVPEQEEPEPNRYLRGIGGVFPRTDGWLSQSLARHLSRDRSQDEPPEGT